MRFIDYLKDKALSIVVGIGTLFLIVIIMLLFQTNIVLMFFVITFLISGALIIFINEGYRKITFYNKFKKMLDNLDKKYLITEMVQESDFLEGSLLLEYLYEIDKGFHEELNTYLNNNKDFREYIELWCHEIKTPLSTAKLIAENNRSSVTKSISEELTKMENFVEQVLFYSRSDAVEKDYLVTEIDLKKVVDNVVLKNKKDLIAKKIKVNVLVSGYVNSDSKWLEFIINQIVTNSIKYSKKNPIIDIISKKNKNNIILSIKDNGIGILSSEVDKIFDKGFTGSNGRKNYNSTGMGLYLCEKLCNKLNHSISAVSEIDEGTTINIVFPLSSMTKIK